MSNAPWNPQTSALGVPPTSYANGVQVLFSPWDMVLDFLHLSAGQAVVEGPSGETHVEPQVVAQSTQRIVMSPQHAKALHRVLGQNIANYESQFGQIPDINLTPEAAT